MSETDRQAAANCPFCLPSSEKKFLCELRRRTCARKKEAPDTFKDAPHLAEAACRPRPLYVS